MNFEEFFCQKSAGSAGWMNFVNAALGNASYGERWVKMSVISTKINKLGTIGRGVFEICELMHNVLSNEKMPLRSGITNIFAIYLDLFKFRAINES